jgi:hypothetical protein
VGEVRKCFGELRSDGSQMGLHFTKGDSENAQRKMYILDKQKGKKLFLFLNSFTKQNL